MFIEHWVLLTLFVNQGTRWVSEVAGVSGVYKYMLVECMRKLLALTLVRGMPGPREWHSTP